MLLVHGVMESGYVAHSGSFHKLPRTAKYRVGQKKNGLFLTVNNLFCA